MLLEVDIADVVVVVVLVVFVVLVVRAVAVLVVAVVGVVRLVRLSFGKVEEEFLYILSCSFVLSPTNKFSHLACLKVFQIPCSIAWNIVQQLPVSSFSFPLVFFSQLLIWQLLHYQLQPKNRTI